MHQPTLIPWMVRTIVAMILTIAVSAFALSFTNLTATAVDAGIPLPLAYLWPICLDCFLVVATLFIFISNHMNKTTAPGWTVLIVFTGVSAGFNIVHSPDNLVAQAAHAIPPVALCICLEVLMIVLRYQQEHASTASVQMPDPEPRSDELPAETTPEPLTQEETLPELPRPKPAGKSNAIAVAQYFAVKPDASIKQASKDLHLSWGTVKTHKERIPAIEGYQ